MTSLVPERDYDFFKEQFVTVKPEVVFPSGDEEKGPAFVESVPSLRVRVNGNYRVCHAGKAFTADSRPFEMPADTHTDRLLKSGVLSVVPAKGK